MISTVIPYQFAYIVACMVQLITNTRALRAAQEAVGFSYDTLKRYL